MQAAKCAPFIADEHDIALGRMNATRLFVLHEFTQRNHCAFYLRPKFLLTMCCLVSTWPHHGVPSLHACEHGPAMELLHCMHEINLLVDSQLAA
jgi:hypothetical protein